MPGDYWYSKDRKGSNQLVMFGLISMLVLCIFYALFFQNKNKNKEQNKNIINKEAVDTLKKDSIRN